MTTPAHYAGCHRVHLACARERVRRLRLDLAESEEALSRLERREAAQDAAGWSPTVITTHRAARVRPAPQTGAQAPYTHAPDDGPEAA